MINLQAVTNWQYKIIVLIEKNQLIELIYDADLVDSAELLFDSGAVTNLASLPSSLFVCKVLDGIQYEVEIQSPFAKKQKASCECRFFKENNICKHIVAALLKIRAERKRKVDARLAATKPLKTSKLSSLNINHILEEISSEELASFVKSYAKTDKKFTTQLKVHFARKIDLVDNADKYKAILNNIVKPNTGSQSRASSSDIRAISQVLGDFADQINDCIALGQYREAFNIFSSAFAKLEYVRHHYTFHRDKLNVLSKNYHQIISFFLEEKLPPELRISLFDFLLDLNSRSYYQYDDSQYNIINLIIDKAKNQDKGLLRNNIEHLISTRPQREKPLLIAMWVKLSGKISKSELEYLKPFGNQFVEIVDYMLAYHLEQPAVKMLESILKPRKIEKEVASRLVYLYVRTKNIKKLKETSKQAYLNTGDIKYIDVIKREFDAHVYESVIQELEEELLITRADPNLLIRIYKREENWAGLLLYLDKLDNLEILRQHDALLYKNERNTLIDLYKNKISRYLDEHIGDVASAYMENLKTHFIHQHFDGLLSGVHTMLKEKYSHRQKLIELFSK
ncbi:MAG: SWIM zinc finger family protein [Saprospiraceae bacterium]|nr:SWIM zinc finger family protein [Saprospiraceae bacterium]MBK8670796.1 SWIM zinc finger family protein [Saprospiraceae bacterium]